MNQNKGWVKLWRDQFVHEISAKRPWCDGYAWSYLYSRANFKDTIVNFRNQYIPVQRGQFITSKLKLQEIFGWSKKRTNSFLTSLEVRGMSTTKSTNRFIVITICNYDKYQSKEDEMEPTEGTIKGPTESQQSATEKNDKEKKDIYTPSGIPACPHEQIIDLYNQTLPTLPKVKFQTPERKKTLAARWKENKARQSVDWWKGYFEHVAECSYLLGAGNRGWVADFDWLIKGSNMIHICEGRYDRKN